MKDVICRPADKNHAERHERPATKTGKHGIGGHGSIIPSEAQRAQLLPLQRSFCLFGRMLCFRRISVSRDARFVLSLNGNNFCDEAKCLIARNLADSGTWLVLGPAELQFTGCGMQVFLSSEKVRQQSRDRRSRLNDCSRMNRCRSGRRYAFPAAADCSLGDRRRASGAPASSSAGAPFLKWKQ